MNSLQSFSTIVGGVFLLPILVSLILRHFFKSWFDFAGGLIVGLACLLGPIWFVWMIGRLIYLKFLN